MLFQMLMNHLVDGLVYGRELEDDLVGTSLGNTKLRSNEYHTENDQWKEVVVSQSRVDHVTRDTFYCRGHRVSCP